MQVQGVKRKDPPTSTAIVVSKKTKNEGEIIAVDTRTSSLKSPIMLLEGHQAELNTVKFSPDGQSLASAGVDKQIRMFSLILLVFMSRVLSCCLRPLLTLSALGSVRRLHQLRRAEGPQELHPGAVLVLRLTV
jgi:WD40 repeat protein